MPATTCHGPPSFLSKVSLIVCNQMNLLKLIILPLTICTGLLKCIQQSQGQETHRQWWLKFKQWDFVAPSFFLTDCIVLQIMQTLKQTSWKIPEYTSHNLSRISPPAWCKHLAPLPLDLLAYRKSSSMDILPAKKASRFSILCTTWRKRGGRIRTPKLSVEFSSGQVTDVERQSSEKRRLREQDSNLYANSLC